MHILGIWRGNSRPFNDRDESAAYFFQNPGLFQAWSFSGSEKRNCLKRKKTVTIRVMIAQLILYQLFDCVNLNVNLKSVCELAIHAVSTIQTLCRLMSFLQFHMICTIWCI